MPLHSYKSLKGESNLKVQIMKWFIKPQQPCPHFWYYYLGVSLLPVTTCNYLSTWSWAGWWELKMYGEGCRFWDTGLHHPPIHIILVWVKVDTFYWKLISFTSNSTQQQCFLTHLCYRWVWFLTFLNHVLFQSVFHFVCLPRLGTPECKSWQGPSEPCGSNPFFPPLRKLRAGEVSCPGTHIQ